MDKILLRKFEYKNMHVTKKLNKYVRMSFAICRRRESIRRDERNIPIKEGPRVKYFEDKNRK
jgi:hypothetical protein